MMNRWIPTTVRGLLVFTLVLTFLPGLTVETAVAQSPAPLSSMVAVAYVDDDGTGATNAADFVKARVEQYANDELPDNVQFPLINTSTDSVRTIQGFRHNVVISWLEPLTWNNSVDAPRFGANNDYIAYFGDGWDEDSLSPIYRGSDNAGWVWSNHEYVSNSAPTLTSAPAGQHLTLARQLQSMGVLTNDVTEDKWSQEDINTYIAHFKQQVGGSWMRIVQDPGTGTWSVDRNADNLRYDGSNQTLLTVSGQTLSAQALVRESDIPSEEEEDEEDEEESAEASKEEEELVKLPEGVVPGIMGDCSGGQTPWGTILTGEENVQSYYGDLEAAWTSNNAFVSDAGFSPGGPIDPIFEAAEATAFGSTTDPAGLHNRDFYGYISEIDVGTPSNDYYESASSGGDGIGHRKIGSMGRVRWENADVVTNGDWELTPGEPVVIYGANDRRGGRIYKFVSSEPYTEGMSKAEVRALIDDGKIYVAHLEGLDIDTGWTVDGEMPTEDTAAEGRWIEMSITSTDIAPNAAALGEGTTVGEALQDAEWNNIGGFTSDNDVRMALFTAANKIGVSELNRPEDVEWNPSDPSGTPRIYVAFTNHTRQIVNNEDGVMYDPATHVDESPKRDDNFGSIMSLVESNTDSPATSSTFSYFIAWKGSAGGGLFEAAAPDNLMIDREGGVWFGTDGNISSSRNALSDGLYYLDQDPAHKDTPTPTFGLAFRVLTGPSDSEATGPAFSADMGTIFFNVQHPGERFYSSWPPRR